MNYTEVCSCGSKIDLKFDEAYRESAWKMAQDWRENHKHEMSGNPDSPLAPECDDMPMIVESVSSHERALPFGFTAEDGAYVS